MHSHSGTSSEEKSSFGVVNFPYKLIVDPVQENKLQSQLKTLVFNINTVWDKFKKGNILGLVEMLFGKVELLAKQLDEFQMRTIAKSDTSARGQFLMEVSL